MADILLHICCAPCVTAVGDALSRENIEWKGFFFNPNIHPFTEFRLRRDCLIQYCGQRGWPLETDSSYPLEAVVQGMLNAHPRCAFCYKLRLERTAEAAAELGIPKFSTTLAISPYQDHDLIRFSGGKAAEKFGVEFVYRDFRHLYRDSVAMSLDQGLYRQKYCGCVFSEADRYIKKRRKSKD